MITIHAYHYRKQARWRFILNHAGLWLALFAGFLGSSDTQTLRIPIYKGEPSREAFDMNGASHYLDYEIELNSFAVEYYRMITEDGYDLVSGWKQKRYDPLSKTIPTKLFNATARKVSGIKNLHDFNCGLKAYRKDVIKNIEVYGEMHRYIPYLAKNAGFKKIGEKVVRHQARKFGKTKFGGWNRFFNGYLDLISLWFLSTFGIKPMHFFGILGSLMFFVGFVAVIIVGASKLYYMNQGMPYRLVTDSPYFYLSLTSMIIGTQLFVAGFLGELISRNAPERNKYQIEKMI